MRKFVKATFLVGCCVLASGCQHAWNSLESQARVDPRTVAAYRGAGETIAPAKVCELPRLRGDSHDVILDLDCFRLPDTPMGTTAYRQAAGNDAMRNRLASVLIKHSDDVCVAEMGDLSAREAISNTLLGTMTSALSTVSSIVTGEKLKSWLSGGATFTNATRDHINSEVFRNVLASAMAKAIQGSRDIQRKQLIESFDEPGSSYSVDQMISDVNRYHQTCSFYNGLVLVVDAVNRASPSIAKEYRDKSAAIADLKMAITDLRMQAAATNDPEAKAALEKQIADLSAQVTKIQIERSELGDSVPPAAPKEDKDTDTETDTGTGNQQTDVVTNGTGG